MVNVLTTLDVYIELLDIHLQGPTKQQNIRGIYSHNLFQAGAKYRGGKQKRFKRFSNCFNRFSVESCTSAVLNT